MAESKLHKNQIFGKRETKKNEKNIINTTQLFLNQNNATTSLNNLNNFNNQIDTEELKVKLIDIGNCSFNYRKVICYTHKYLNDYSFYTKEQRVQ